MCMEKMKITKNHVALCKCHNKILRCNSKENLDIILSNVITCELCNSQLEYKGEFEMDGETIIDESFTEQKIQIEQSEKKQKRAASSERTKMTKELALSKKLITEDGMPFKKEDKDTSNGAIITAIKLAVIEENFNLLNSIFLEYNELIKTNVARYIGKKEKQYIKSFLNIEV